MRIRVGRRGYLLVVGTVASLALLTTAPASAGGDEPSPEPSSASSEASPSEASPSPDPSDAPIPSDPALSLASPVGSSGDSEDAGDVPAPDDATGGDRARLRKQAGGVDVVDDSFEPAQITVDAGAAITWSNSGPNPHTVTADDGSFRSGTLQSGESFSSTFETPGSFAYYCEFHGGPGGSGMSGVVVVRGADVGGTDTGGGEAARAGGTDLPATGLNTALAAIAALVFSMVGVGSLHLSRRIARQPRSAPDLIRVPGEARQFRAGLRILRTRTRARQRRE